MRKKTVVFFRIRRLFNSLVSLTITIIPFIVAGSLTDLSGQEPGFRSIHREESEFYGRMGSCMEDEFRIQSRYPGENSGPDFALTRMVFGYHPYWGGNNYLDYQWSLLSDLCYFSYEVDPYTGYALDLHGWTTAPVIDSAMANGVRVHLCVTLFSDHNLFLSNPSARANLVSYVIQLLQNRNATGVNLDFEAMPSGTGPLFTSFVSEFADALHSAIPGSLLSIAAPAVNWSNTFDIPALSEDLEFFMVMCYDYYWNGSDFAGPVAGMHSMTGNYDYNVSRTVSYYQSQGVAPTKLVIGMPYYGRQWPTQFLSAPSPATGNGVAYTYRYIRDNGNGFYNPFNLYLEMNSRGPYYGFTNGSFFQCFIDLEGSLSEKYDLVNRRGLAGIGIWALGYDNGYSELWELISEKFSTGAVLPESDTIRDSGGSAFHYYNDENYVYTLESPETKQVRLTFSGFSLDPGDTLFFFDGPESSSPLLGKYSGNMLPPEMISTENYLTLRFVSGPGGTAAGWKAFYDYFEPVGMISTPDYNTFAVRIYPIPFLNALFAELALPESGNIEMTLAGVSGGEKMVFFNQSLKAGVHKIELSSFLPEKLGSGVFILSVTDENRLVFRTKLVKMD